MTFTVNQLEILPFMRYEFRIRAREVTVLPPFLGTTLRGAFGNALKAITCSVAHGECQRCLLVERCLYPRLFETTARSHSGLLSRAETTPAPNSKSDKTTRPDSGLLSRGATASAPKSNTTARTGSGLLSRGHDAPRPFVFVPPLPHTDTGVLRARDDLLRWRVRVTSDQSVVFGLYLLGSAVPELPYVIHAINAMAHNGIGAERARFALDEVAAHHVNGAREVVYTAAEPFVRSHDQRSTLGSLVCARLADLCAVRNGLGTKNGHEVTLRFLTPTRLRIKGQVVEQPSFAQLVRLLSLRLSMVAQAHGDLPLTYDYQTMLQRSEQVSTSKSNLSLLALERRSNRQDRKLDIDGFTGDISFTGDGLSEFLPLLLAGEFLHVGSGTAFGLGRYEVMS